MATIDIYDKGQTDALLAGKADAADLPSAAELVPDYSGASADDVLTIENGAPVWKAAGGSGGGVEYKEFNTYADFRAWAAADMQFGDIIYLMIQSQTGDGSTFKRVTGVTIVSEKDNTNVYCHGGLYLEKGSSKYMVARVTLKTGSDSITALYFNSSSSTSNETISTGMTLAGSKIKVIHMIRN